MPHFGGAVSSDPKQCCFCWNKSAYH